MSLINEALKKAQRQRSLENAPLSSAPSGVAAAAVSTHVRSASHKSSLAPLWFGLGILALGVGATVVVMRYGIGSDTPATPAAAKPVAVAPSPAIAPATPVVVAPVTPAPEPANGAPMVVLPPIQPVSPTVVPPAPATPTPTPAATASTPAAPTVTAAQPAAVPTESTNTSASPAPTTPAPAPVKVEPVFADLPPAEREAKVYAFISALRLAGVRGVDRDARVLMNERVWRLNDVVAPEFGLRLSAVRPNLLVFTDALGNTYEKPY